MNYALNIVFMCIHNHLKVTVLEYADVVRWKGCAVRNAELYIDNSMWFRNITCYISITSISCVHKVKPV